MFIKYFIIQFKRYSSDLPPSQGGKYSGFGYTKEPPSRSQSQEFVDTALSSLASVGRKISNKNYFFIILNV